MTKATISKTTPAEVTLNVTVTKEELQSAKQAVLSQLKKNVKVPGFRPGKAPDEMVERQADPAKFQVDVVEKVLSATYTEAIAGHKIRPLAEPQVNVTKFVPFDELEYEAKIAIIPTITFDYEKLKVKHETPKVSDAEIKEALETLRRQFADRESVNRAAKLGDEVRFDFKGERDGEAVDGASGMNTILELGSGKFIPGYEDELVGMKKGETKTFDITFPEAYHATDLAGQTVTFTATVNEVRAIKLAKLDDTFAKRAAQLETLDALKEDIKQNLLLGKEEDSRKVYETAVLDAVIKASKLEVSEMLEHEQAHELEHDFEKQIESSGMKLDDWLKVQKKDAKDFHQELHVEARRRISIGLIIRDIIEKQKFNVTSAEVEGALAKMRENYSDPQIIKELDDPKFKNDLANRLVTQKAVDWLCHNAKNDVKEKSKKTTKK